MKAIARFFVGVKKEMTKVRWPNKKEMSVYSLATLIFIIIFAVFFGATDFVVAALKKLVS